MRSCSEVAAGDCANAPPAAMSTTAEMTRRRIEWAVRFQRVAAACRATRNASSAAPLAPAVSPLGITRIGMSACSCRCTGMPDAISARNQRWDSSGRLEERRRRR